MKSRWGAFLAEAFSTRSVIFDTGFPEALCDFQRQQTALVDAAGQGFIAFADASRQFAGQCLGVQHGFAIHNDAIQRDFFHRVLPR